MDEAQRSPALGAGPLRGGKLLAEISNAIVAILREHYGRGPMKAKTYALDDIIVVVMRGSGFTPLEQTIMDSGQPERVVDMRHDFQNMVSKRFTDTTPPAGGAHYDGTEQQQRSGLQPNERPDQSPQSPPPDTTTRTPSRRSSSSTPFKPRAARNPRSADANAPPREFGAHYIRLGRPPGHADLDGEPTEAPAGAEQPAAQAAAWPATHSIARPTPAGAIAPIDQEAEDSVGDGGGLGRHHC